MTMNDGSSKMKDLHTITVAQLKERLRQMNLSTSGNKAELLLRLNEADPSGQWMRNVDADMDATEGDLEGATAAGGAEEGIRPHGIQHGQPGDLERELEFSRRESELMRREMELMRRENALLRSMTQDMSVGSVDLVTTQRSESAMSRVNLNNLKEMLPVFDGKKGSYQCWKEQLMVVKQMYCLDDNMTKLLLGMKLTGDAAEWFHSVPAHLSLAVDELLRRMEAMYDRREKRLTLRKEFESREWQHGETFAEYFHKKLVLANKVPIDENEMVDYLIEGIPVKAIKYQAMMQQFPNKEIMLKALENISLGSDHKIQYKMEKQPVVKNVNKAAGSVKKIDSDLGVKQELKCFNCSKIGHIAARCQMPKRERGTCFNCFQQGHKAKECPMKDLTKADPVKDKDRKTDINSVFIPPMVEVGNFCRDLDLQLSNDSGDYMLNCKLDTLLDTGSPISFIKDSLVPPNLITPVQSGDNGYRGLNDSILETKGRLKVKMALNRKEPKDVLLLVVPSSSMKTSVVIGRDILQQFFEKENLTGEEAENQVIQEILNIDIEDLRKESQYSLDINPDVNLEAQSVVRKLFVEGYVEPERPEQPVTNAEVKLILKDPKPFHFNPRRLSHTEKNALRTMLDSLLEKGVIRVSESEYASPIVLVRKKTGDLRLCIDFRELNKQLIRDNYPLPNIEDLIDSLYGKTYYSRLDLKNGFYHIKMSEDSIKYTAFMTPFGQYEFMRMPFGLKIAPPRFQRYINQVLAELIRESKIVVYMDDILVLSETLEEHVAILQETFRLFVLNKLQLRIEKCTFLQTEIEFLGYSISEKGIRPTKEGVKAVQRIPVPRNVKEVHSFVALCSYFRKFIQSFSIIAKPLYDLLRKNVPFKFESEELLVFEKLKEKLVSAPVLAIYNPNNETELHCDASMAGFGAVLMQSTKDKHFHPVFFFSKRTTDAESRYHSFELEMLAIIYATRRFRVYLSGLKFKLVTDCNALTLALKKKDITPRINRWILELLEYDYVTEHRPNTRMTHVDALSRLPCEILVINDNSFELNLALSQGRDSKLRELREELQKSEDSQFEMRNGIIFKKYNQDLLFYVPQAMESHVLYKYHDQMGHLGVEKTLDVIKKSYWFPNMKHKIKEHIANCLKCISFSPSTGKKEGYLHCIPKGQTPFEMYHIDHYGPIDKERLTKRYLLVVVDSFTKFTKLYPTKTTATNEVINQLTAHFCNYSRPRTIVSDRGTAFTSSEFKIFCEENNVQHICTATHSPKANGQVERTNRVLGPMISKLIDNDEKVYWYKILSDIEFAINNTVHKTTGETPSKLLYGVDQRGKVVDKVREYLETNFNDNNCDLSRLRARTAEKIKKSQKYNKEYFDRKRKPPHVYKVGDYVMIRNIDTTKGASTKIIPKFKGPYEVARVLRHDRYVLKDVSDHQVTRKPYEGTWEAMNIRPWTTN